MYEEDETVFRDIEIKPAHTLGDLVAVINTSYSLPEADASKFFMSNDSWQRGRNIHPLMEVPEKKGKARVQVIPTIVSYLDDPHQHFIYEYRGTQEFIFLIELISVGGKEDLKTNYPVCVRSQGASPYKREDVAVHFAKHPVPVAQEDEEIEDDDEPETASAFTASDEEADAEDLEVIEGEEHDLMEGDAIKEADDDEESADDDLVADDDFNPEDLSEGGDDFDDEELR